MMVWTLEAVFSSFFSFPNKIFINLSMSALYINYYKPEVMREFLKSYMKLNKPLQGQSPFSLNSTKLCWFQNYFKWNFIWSSDNQLWQVIGQRFPFILAKKKNNYKLPMNEHKNNNKYTPNHTYEHSLVLISLLS